MLARFASQQGNGTRKAEGSAARRGRSPQQHPFSSSRFFRARRPRGSGRAARLHKNNLFVEGPARCESTSRVNHKRARRGEYFMHRGDLGCGFSSPPSLE